MTAPDDVRARFEAWARGKGMDVTRWNELKRGVLPNEYMKLDTDTAWVGYRAAHAGLSGEVRELVEVVRELADDLREWGATDFQLAMRAARLDAALAKFTHQEKP